MYNIEENVKVYTYICILLHLHSVYIFITIYKEII